MMFGAVITLFTLGLFVGLWAASLVVRGASVDLAALGKRIAPRRFSARSWVAVDLTPRSMVRRRLGIALGVSLLPAAATAMMAAGTVERWADKSGSLVSYINLWGVGAATVLLLSIVALCVGVRADPSRGRRRCPRCWYDMSGTPGRLCSECGHEPKAEARLLRTRRSPILIKLALLGLPLSFALHRTPYVRSMGWLGAVPTSALIAGMGVVPFDWLSDPLPTSTAGGTLLARLQDSDMPDWQEHWLGRKTFAGLRSSSRERRIRSLLFQYPNGQPVSPALLDTVIDAMTDPRAGAQDAASTWLWTVGNGADPATQDALNARRKDLLAAFKADDSPLSFMLGQLLTNLHEPPLAEMREYLGGVLADPSLPVQSHLSAARYFMWTCYLVGLSEFDPLEPLGDAFATACSDGREALLEQFTRIHYPLNQPGLHRILLYCLADADDGVSAAAAEAVNSFELPAGTLRSDEVARIDLLAAEVVRQLRSRPGPPLPYLRALRKLERVDPSLLPDLIGILGQGDDASRVEAAECLLDIGPTAADALPALDAAATDPRMTPSETKSLREIAATLRERLKADEQ